MNQKYQKAMDDLAAGRDHNMKLVGNSMTPIIQSGSKAKFRATDDYQIGDVVFCKVKGRFMTHLVTKIDADGRYMISNNHGHDNGWTNKIFGRIVKLNDEPFGRAV